MLYLGIGTNEGDRLGQLRRAISSLAALSATRPGALEIRAISPVYESQAMLPAGAPDAWNRPYLNLVLECRSSLAPPDLLALTQAVERALGREARERWAPRVIDIDLLHWDGVTLDTPTLKLPHPGLRERPFALLPLSDLAPTHAVPWRTLEPEDIPFGTEASPFSILPELVGVLNVTPDSFSDGGRFNEALSAAAQAERLVADGATVIDVGAESTRPGARLISASEEWARLAPVLERLAPSLASRAALSIDTRHAETARQAIALGATWINDVSGFEDPALVEAVAGSPASAVVMHHLGVPPVADRTLSSREDPVDQLLAWGRATLDRLERAGLPRSRVVLDPGIGFGKTSAQTRAIIAGIGRLKRLGCRIYVGHSRKSFLKALTGDLPAASRDPETQIVSVELARRGADFLRVHDVSGNLRALRAAFAVDATIRWEAQGAEPATGPAPEPGP